MAKRSRAVGTALIALALPLSTEADIGRAVKDALHRNSLTVGPAFGFPREAMLVDIRVGVPDPSGVDKAEVAACAPYGRVSVEAVEGGLRIPKEEGATIIANAIVSVSFDIETVAAA